MRSSSPLCRRTRVISRESKGCMSSGLHSVTMTRALGSRRSRRLLPIPIFASLDKEDGVDEAETEEDLLSEEYSQVMQSKMGGSLTYEHERGINYTRILPNLIVGSCLQTAEDAAMLREREKVKCVLCLQQDTDMEYFDLDIIPVLESCQEVGISHYRWRVNDFDPYDLRLKLPEGVTVLDQAVRECKKGECVYVHCTAGLGRAPAVSIAYMYWVLGMPLLEAHKTLTTLRPCNPKLDSIRQATCDLLFGLAPKTVKIGMKAGVNVKVVQVAGLDMGWENPMECGKEGDRFVLEKDLPAGRFQYKFIVDGKWTYSADSPIMQDGENKNNYIDVVESSQAYAIRQRLMSQEAPLREEEKDIITRKICKQ